MAGLEGQWVDIQKLTERTGPMATTEFDPSPFCIKWLQEECKVLCIGAGGLGCELLKDLALVGFRNIEVIDMDTIDYSNLNRQFLFRTSDVGLSKALAASAFINKRIAGARVVPHHARIEEFDDEFYQGFHCIVSGLDSVNARRWLNQKLVSLSALDDSDNWDAETCITCVNGGTEGFKGEARIIKAHFTPCFECLVDLFPKDPFNFPMCTTAHTPRQPEHCIVHAMTKSWTDAFGEKKIDGDSPDDITWVMKAAIEHADKFNLTGVTYKLTQGVVKRIIPAIASTNAVVSAACANEAFKAVTMCHAVLNNFMNYSGDGGCNTNVIPNEKNTMCLVCGTDPLDIEFDKDAVLADFIAFIKEDKTTFNFFTEPVLMYSDPDAETAYMYAGYGMFKSQTEGNLTKSLEELLTHSGAEVHLKEKGTHKINVLKITWKEKESN